MDPGLVYDITNVDYVNFLCGVGYGLKEIQIITKSVPSCPTKKPLAENLNYPSIAAWFLNAKVGATSKNFLRTVTNVGEVKVESPKGVTIVVKPTKLAFTAAVKKLSYVVTVTTDSKNLMLDDSSAVFGSISWSDGVGKHVVRIPIAVTLLTPL